MVDAAASAAQIRETVARAPHNRYPVGEGSLDKLLGVVCLKDLFLHLGDEGFDLRRLVAPAKFFHEGFEVYNALEQLRTEQLGYGIICDEFGVTRGIITLRDIFEALVGELPDPARGAGHRPAQKTAAVWSTGNALSTTFSTGSVWKTPCPATPTTPSAA